MESHQSRPSPQEQQSDHFLPSQAGSPFTKARGACSDEKTLNCLDDWLKTPLGVEFRAKILVKRQLYHNF